MIETTLEFFKKHGKKSERFGNTLERVGWDVFQEEVEKALALRRKWGSGRIESNLLIKKQL